MTAKIVDFQERLLAKRHTELMSEYDRARSEGVRQLDTPSVAKIVARALKDALPASYKFTVRTERYSGGSAVRVRPVGRLVEDERLVALIESIVRRHAGSGFDGSIDLRYPIYHWLKPDGAVEFAGTEGTQASGGDVPADFTLRPDGAILVRLGASVCAFHNG